MDSEKKDTPVDVKLHISEMSPREQFVEDYNHCPLCGTELLYTHVTDFSYLKVNEEAHCEACNIRTKKDEHVLQ